MDSQGDATGWELACEGITGGDPDQSAALGDAVSSTSPCVVEDNLRNLDEQQGRRHALFGGVRVGGSKAQQGWHEAGQRTASLLLQEMPALEQPSAAM